MTLENPVAVVSRDSQTRTLFSKFERVNNALISDFISSVPETFTGCADGLKASDNLASDFILQNRMRLKKFASKFHQEAQTLTGGVEERISMLGDPASQIIVSTHQPNLFAYAGVFKKIVLLDAMKEKVEKEVPSKKIINLFLIIDHDFIDELWVRLAQLPSIDNSSGILELRLPVSSSKRWQMVCNTPPPGLTILNNWKRQVRSWIRNHVQANGDKKSNLMDNFDKFWNEVENAYSGAKSYADLNSFLMSRIVNWIWGYDTVFVRLSEIPTVFEDGFSFLLSNFKVYSEALKRTEISLMQNGIDTGVSSVSHLNAPVWLHCRCGSKASAKILIKGHRQEMFLSGPCISCKKHLEICIGNADNIDISGHINDLSPKAIPIPMLLSRDLGIACYATGTGGIGYMVDGSVVSKRLALRQPLVVVWPSKDHYNGIGQARAIACIEKEQAFGTTTQDYVERLQKKNEEYEMRVRPLLEERRAMVMAGEPIDGLLDKIFVLKEDQRMVRAQLKKAEKIHNATSISPCFVDYAINFGIKETGIRWRQHLLEKDKLDGPVFL